MTAPVILICAACLFFFTRNTWSRTWPWAAVALSATAAAAWFVRVAELAQPPQGSLPSSLIWDDLAIICQWMGIGLGVCFILMVFDAHRDQHSSPRSLGLLLLMLAGLMLVAMSNHLMVMFFALELIGLSIGLLLYLTGSLPTAREAAIKYILLNLLSSIVLLYGFSFLYGLTGTMNLDGIRSVLVASYAPPLPQEPIGSGSRLGIVAIVLILAGLGFRMAVVPFHLPLPDIHQGTTPWNAGLLATIPKAAGLIAVFRILTQSTVGFEQTGELIVLVLVMATMTVGNILALQHSEIRGVLAYTTIAHGGFLLLGAAVGFWDFAHPESSLQTGSSLPAGLQASVFALLAYLLAIAGLFAVFVHLSGQDRSFRFIEDWSGLFRTDALAAIAAAVAWLSLAGLPPLPGFWARLVLLSAALSVHAHSSSGTLLASPHPMFVLVTIVVIVNLVLMAAVALRILFVMFFNDPISQTRVPGRQPALATALLVTLLAFGTGLLPGPLLDYCRTIGQAAPRSGQSAPEK